MKIITLFITLLTTNIIAQELSCEELWVKRNAIFAKHGYCFKSKEGIALFGKKCKRDSIKLTEKEKKEISKIKELDEKLHCNYKEIPFKDAYYQTTKDICVVWKPFANSGCYFYLPKNTKNLKVIAKDDTGKWYKIAYNAGVGIDLIGWVEKNKLLKQDKIDEKTQKLTQFKEKIFKVLSKYKNKDGFENKWTLRDYLYKDSNPYKYFKINNFNCKKKGKYFNCKIKIEDHKCEYDKEDNSIYCVSYDRISLFSKIKLLANGSLKVKEIKFNYFDDSENSYPNAEHKRKRPYKCFEYNASKFSLYKFSEKKEPLRYDLDKIKIYYFNDDYPIMEYEIKGYSSSIDFMCFNENNGLKNCGIDVTDGGGFYLTKNYSIRLNDHILAFGNPGIVNMPYLSLQQKNKDEFIEGKEIKCTNKNFEVYESENELNGKYVCYWDREDNGEGKGVFVNCFISKRDCRESGYLYFNKYQSYKMAKKGLKICETKKIDLKYVDVPNGLYVCYDYKKDNKYYGCFRSKYSCKSLNKEHFGHYPNIEKSADAMMRCITSLIPLK